jgi:hypothetical protein
MKKSILLNLRITPEVARELDRLVQVVREKSDSYLRYSVNKSFLILFALQNTYRSKILGDSRFLYGENRYYSGSVVLECLSLIRKDNPPAECKDSKTPKVKTHRPRRKDKAGLRSL